MVVFELLRGALDLVGLDGTLAIGIATVLVGVYYSRELARLLSRAAQVVSIAALILGGVGLAVVVGLATGWISIDGGLVGELLRLAGEIMR